MELKIGSSCLALLLLCLPNYGEGALGKSFPHITNAVLGRGFNFGSKTIKENMLKDNYTYEIVNVTKSVSKYSFIEDDSDVSKLLDVSGELKFGINAGFSLNVHGRAHYVRETDIKSDDIQMLFSINILDYYEMAPRIETEGREDCGELEGDAGAVTHVVGGILYGAQCVVSIVWKAKNDVDRNKIMGDLNLQLGMKGTFNVEAQGNVTFNNSAEKATHNYDLKITCNMELGKFPKSMQEIAAFADQLPKLFSEKKKNGEARGAPISMFLVPISEIKACSSVQAQDIPNVPPAPTVLDFLFTEMENMLEDLGTAKESLSKCRRQYPMLGINEAAVFDLENAFYILSRAISRRLVLLKEELVSAQALKKVHWSDPSHLLTFTKSFEQKYFDFVVPPLDEAMASIIGSLSNEVQQIAEGSESEKELRDHRYLVGNKVWRMRVGTLCAQRRKLSDTLRAEF